MCVIGIAFSLSISTLLFDFFLEQFKPILVKAPLYFVDIGELLVVLLLTVTVHPIGLVLSPLTYVCEDCVSPLFRLMGLFNPHAFLNIDMKLC